jgi:hypothetical protein
VRQFLVISCQTVTASRRRREPIASNASAVIAMRIMSQPLGHIIGQVCCP